MRLGALWSFLFVVSEALIGAGLVRFEWVASNDSQERVYVMAFHLLNTFFLLAAMTLTAWHARRERGPVTGSGKGLYGVALVAVLAVGASGAVTALGDTLIFQAGLTPRESPLVGALVSKRMLHPTLALAAFVVVAWVVHRYARNRYGRFAVGLFAAQIALGGLNVYLLAPVWMQLLHLAVSDALWVSLVLAFAEALVGKGMRDGGERKGLSPA